MPAAPHIFTLTGNLLAERTLEFSHWTAGRTQRAGRESFHTRGKGVNVSNMLHRLGSPSTALLFAGGAAGAECEAWLRQRGLAYHAFATHTATRTGTVIWSDTQAETTFLGPDVVPDAAAVQACARFLDAQPDGQVLALCGSFPGWDAAQFIPLREALGRWLKRGIIAADVYGPPLYWLAQQPLAVIKINRAEFDAFFPAGQPAESLPTRLRVARRQWPVRHWIVTDGPKSIWLSSDTAEPQELVPPVVQEVSPTGSGDVFFACLLEAYFGRGQSLHAAAAYAMPFAVANATHPGVADFPLPLVR
ncbi:MAG: hypothetical protein KA257_05185 [Opitutaceae bacterium]|nr:hypothetical protein [Opitutaceae bacterium]MBP9913702.1 hypothetical protein [Opitutaceae bacterium]